MRKPRCKLSDEFLRLEYESGKSVNQIAKEQGFNRDTISSKLHKIGVEIQTGSRPLDITGQKHGRLTAIKLDHIQGNHHYWLFKCDCGKFKVIEKTNATKGTCKSCGCLANEISGDGYKGLTVFMWSRIKRSAKYRGLKVNLTAEEAYRLYIEQNGKCKLTGIDISLGCLKDKPTASLDRKNSKLNYSVENCQWIHKDVNFMKQEYLDEYFIEMCKLVSKYSESKNEETLTDDIYLACNG